MPTYKRGPVKRPPTHPGELLREETLPAFHLSPAQAARDLGVSRQLLHALLAEKIGVSADMALRLGRLTGSGPEVWLRLQETYDLWYAKRKLGAALKAVPERHKAA